jgi:hypothetical protein
VLSGDAKADKVTVAAQAFATMRDPIAATNAAFRSELDALDAVLESTADGIAKTTVNGATVAADSRWADFERATPRYCRPRCCTAPERSSSSTMRRCPWGS